jgi:hypothetical protein
MGIYFYQEWIQKMRANHILNRISYQKHKVVYHTQRSYKFLLNLLLIKET